MESNVNISIIIPVYNAEKYLNKCLESILVQSYKHFEVIIVDDGSTDGSKDIYNKFIKYDNRFKGYYQNNLGPSSARNLGIKKSEGYYIAFIDADDYIAINYIENLYNEISKHNADLVCSGYYEVSRYNKKPLAINDFKQYIGNTVDKNSFIPSIFEGTGGVLWGKLFKSHIIKSNNLKLDVDVKMSEDLIFVLDYVFYTTTVIVSGTYGYFYNRLNEESISSKQDSDYIKYLIITNKAIETIFVKNGYNQLNFNDLRKKRIWSLLKVITCNIANSHISLLSKYKKIKSLLANQYIKTYLYHFEDKVPIYKLHLFFLKNKLIFIDIIYCKGLKMMKIFNQILKKL